MAISTALADLLTELSAELSLAEAGVPMRGIVEDLRASTPVGYEVKGYVGRGGRTDTPWIGIFNPDISVKPQTGLYVAYIRDPESSAVTLTVQQGSDELRGQVGAAEARKQLRHRAKRIRTAIALTDEPLEPMIFGRGTRQLSYAVGSIAAKTYRAGALPAERVLGAELTSMLRILDAAWDVLRGAEGAEWINEDLSEAVPRPMPEGLLRFVPKRSDNYVVEIEAHSQVKTRLHEKVLNDLERLQTGRGWRVTSEHPIDLVLRPTVPSSGATLIVEVKKVRGGNAVEAVRAAIGQLLTYRFQLFDAPTRPLIGLVAAFSEDIGADLRELLSAELDIAVLWLDGRSWRGCELAKQQGLSGSVTPADIHR